MKPEFYDRSKRVNIYNSIFLYKVVSLIVLVVLTIILSVLYFKDKALFHELSDAATPAFFIVVAICIILFIISIIIDFYILKKTASIGSRLNKLAFIDYLTGLPNRYSCDLLIESFNDPQKLVNAGFILMQLNNLGAVNHKSGHRDGNWLISEFSTILEEVSENYGYVGRNGGNEFIMLMENCDTNKSDMFLMELAKRIQGYNEMNVGFTIDIIYSRVLNSEEHLDTIADLVSAGYSKIRQMPHTLS